MHIVTPSKLQINKTISKNERVPANRLQPVLQFRLYLTTASSILGIVSLIKTRSRPSLGLQCMKSNVNTLIGLCIIRTYFVKHFRIPIQQFFGLDPHLTS